MIHGSASFENDGTAASPGPGLVEAAFSAAVERQDFQPFEQLLEVVSRPYEERPGLEHYAAPAAPGESVRWTFCVT
jgi:serine/tyrosine/threonine adenylyltransferase